MSQEEHWGGRYAFVGTLNRVPEGSLNFQRFGVVCEALVIPGSCTHTPHQEFMMGIFVRSGWMEGVCAVAPL